MTPPRKVVVVQTNFRNELYNCIQSPQHTTTTTTTTTTAICPTKSSSAPQHQLQNDPTKSTLINSSMNGNPGDHLISHHPQTNNHTANGSSPIQQNPATVPSSRSGPLEAAKGPLHISLNNNNNNNHSNGSSNRNNGNQNFQAFEIQSAHNSYDNNHDSFDSSFEDDNHHSTTDNNRNIPSNERLLGTAFCTFMGFALIQTVVALFAKSEAMLGDSAAMIVDALTYLFNWVAERKKAQYIHRQQQQQQQNHHHHHHPYHDDTNANTLLATTTEQNGVGGRSSTSIQDRERHERILERARRKMVLQLELVPPLISVSTLVVVTAVVLHHSIKILILDAHRSKSQQGNPNIHIMMYFSIANLGLDLINVANFAKAKHLFGYETNDKPHEGHTMLSDHDNSHNSHDGDDEGIITAASRNSNNTGLKEGGHFSRKSPKSCHHDDDDDDDDHTANLNMCSAYTHVFADTLRSIAVLVAACLSELVQEITPEEADASAAVVVSALIVLSLIPLCHGLVQTSHELRMIRAEERSDQLFTTTTLSSPSSPSSSS